MSPDDGTPAGGLEPAASLTSVRVRRRKPPVAPSGKRGDLTVKNGAEPSAPSGDIIVLPPPPEPARSPELALLPLPELGAGPAQPIAVSAEETSAAPSSAAEEEQPELLLVAREVEPPLAAEPEPLAAMVPEPLPGAGAEPVDETPSETPPAAAIEAREATPASDAPDDIIDYWDSLRGGRDFPILEDLDRGLVAATWPNTVLLGFAASETPSITRIGPSNGAIEYTAMVTDWILSRGRQSARRARPMQEEQRFPVSDGSARYRLLLLPFSSYGLSCDHVLCHLSRMQDLGAVASFKRWLTG